VQQREEKQAGLIRPTDPATPKRRAFSVLNSNTIMSSPVGQRGSPALQATASPHMQSIRSFSAHEFAKSDLRLVAAGARASPCLSSISFHALDENADAKDSRAKAASVLQEGVPDSKCLSPRPAWLEAAKEAAARKKTEDFDDVAGAAGEAAGPDRCECVREKGALHGEEEDETACQEAPSQEPAEQPAKVVVSSNVESGAVVEGEEGQEYVEGQEGKGGFVRASSLVERLARREHELRYACKESSVNGLFFAL
jgi:hypothetical protein